MWDAEPAGQQMPKNRENMLSAGNEKRAGRLIRLHQIIQPGANVRRCPVVIDNIRRNTLHASGLQRFVEAGLRFQISRRARIGIEQHQSAMSPRYELSHGMTTNGFKISIHGGQCYSRIAGSRDNTREPALMKPALHGFGGLRENPFSRIERFSEVFQVIRYSRAVRHAAGMNLKQISLLRQMLAQSVDNKNAERSQRLQRHRGQKHNATARRRQTNEMLIDDLDR